MNTNILEIENNSKKFIGLLNYDKNNFIEIQSDKKNNNKEYIFSFVISINEKRKQEMANRLEKNFYFIPVEKFPINATIQDKNNIVLKDHIKCIQLAKDMNLEHVFIFEDDVIFIKNWRSIVNNFINNNKTDIIRFDLLPYKKIQNIPNKNNIYFYNLFTFLQNKACLGGYYLTKKAINIILQEIKNIDIENNKVNIEGVFNFLTKTIKNQYTSVPRICIQDWYKTKKSSIQNDAHINNLKNMQLIHYLPIYKSFYPEFLSYTI